MIPNHASTKQIMIAVCKAEELSMLRFRAGEKPFYNELKKNQALRYTYDEKTDEVWQKVLLLAQMDMCSIDLGGMKDKHRDVLNNVSIHKATIRLQLMRLLSCVIDCKLQCNDAITIEHALELRQSISARCWANHPSMLKQLIGIGDGSLKTLVSAGITSFDDLEKTCPRELERIFKRNPPFGNNILKDLDSLPKLELSFATEHVSKNSTGIVMRFRVQIKCQNSTRTRKTGLSHYVILLIRTAEGELLDFRRQSTAKVQQNEPFVVQVLLSEYTTALCFMLTCEDLGK